MELQTTRGYCDETNDDTGTSTVDSREYEGVTKRKMTKRIIAIIVLGQ